MPLTAAVSNPGIATPSAYVSGASDRNANAPFLSVTAVADPAGPATVTRAPASGACEAPSATRPLSAPVVPARAGTTLRSATSGASATIIHLRDMRAFPKAKVGGVSGACTGSGRR